MDPVIFCKRCKMTVQRACNEEDHSVCSLFKSAEARKAHNKTLIEAAKIHTGDGADVTAKDKRTKGHAPDVGRKNDTGKVPLDLLAPEFLIGTAMVLQFGAGKYDPYNWAKGMKWSRVFAALMRHMWAWWGGEKLDRETDMPHLWHAACGLMFLIAYEQRGTGEDDRWKS